MSLNEYLIKARQDEWLRSAAQHRLAKQAKRASAAWRDNAPQRDEAAAAPPLRLVRALLRLVNT
jgi:hypothetical protein